MSFNNVYEIGNTISFALISNGMTGKEWIQYFESRVGLDDWAKYTLSSADFKPSERGTSYIVEVIKGDEFSDEDRMVPKILDKANLRKLIRPNIEVACLIRDRFMGDEIRQKMGLSWIITMHEPVKQHDGDLGLMLAGSYGSEPCLQVLHAPPTLKLSHPMGFHYGFAFVLP